jgi:hypothetical protein
MVKRCGGAANATRTGRRDAAAMVGGDDSESRVGVVRGRRWPSPIVEGGLGVAADRRRVAGGGDSWMDDNSESEMVERRHS